MYTKKDKFVMIFAGFGGNLYKTLFECFFFKISALIILVIELNDLSQTLDFTLHPRLNLSQKKRHNSMQLRHNNNIIYVMDAVVAQDLLCCT